MDLKEILSHDLLPTFPLFDGDLPAHVIKSTLIAEIEAGLDLTQWTQNSCLSTQVVVDFMSSMRQMPLKQFPNSGPEIDAVIT